MRLSQVTAHRHTMPAVAPIAIEPLGPTQPHAGVTATRPAIAPDAAPSIVGAPRVAHSLKVHATVAAAVASSVFAKTWPANPLASRFDPTLNPNHPTHRSDAPIITIGTLCGMIASCP